ncbi:hypothetical protein ACFL2W_00320 [Candidatus Omnitrophota bacterium]
MPEKRDPVLCDKCGSEMVFAKEVFYSAKGDWVYLKYICPQRTGEQGCGSVKRIRFEKEPRVKFRRTGSNSFLID